MEPAHPPGASASQAEGRSESPALEVALAALLCFLPAVAAGYVYDDLLLVRDNPYTHGLGQLQRAFTTSFWAIGAGVRGSLPYYRPLVTVTYILNWVISDGKAWCFHLFNAALHAATTYLVVRITKRWTGRTILAVAVAAIFALHPSRTESVDWIAGRTDVLMTFFLLLSVESSYQGAVRANARERNTRLALSLLSFAMALLSKEAAVLLPILLLVDVFSTMDLGQRGALVRSLRWHAGAGALYLALRALVLPLGPGGPLEFTPRYGFFTVFAYAERILFPWPQTFFHRPVAVEGGQYVLPLPLVVAGFVILAAYAAFTLIVYRRDRASAVLLFAAGAALGPLLNFTHTGIYVTTSDHFLYLPLFLLLAGLARRYEAVLWARSQARAVRALFVGLLAVYLAIDTRRVFDYRDQQTLFEHELRLDPENPQALRALSEVAAREGRLDEAFALLRKGSMPESTRYAVLLPEWRLYENYLRMLGLLGGMTADGNVRDLTLLYREMDALLAGRIASVRGNVGDLELGRAVTPQVHAYTFGYGTRDIVAAEAGFLAARLGDDVHAHELLDSITSEHFDVLTSLQNIALSYARLGDFTAARLWLAGGASHAVDVPQEAQTQEKRRFATAEAFFRRASRASDDVERRHLRAEADLELGAYLRGLRELRPVYLRDPTNAVIGPLYLHLLVVAGLEQEALAVATGALGPEQGATLVRSTRASMSERLRGLRKPEGASDWYAP